MYYVCSKPSEFKGVRIYRKSLGDPHGHVEAPPQGFRPLASLSSLGGVSWGGALGVAFLNWHTLTIRVRVDILSSRMGTWILRLTR